MVAESGAAVGGAPYINHRYERNRHFYEQSSPLSQPWLVIWLGGVALVLTRPGVGHWRVRGLSCRAQPLPPAFREIL